MPRLIRPPARFADSVAAHLPTSKSHVQRALIVTAFMPGEQRIEGVVPNQDVEVCADALRSLGAQISRDGNAWVVGDPARLTGRADVWCAENGTTTRMLGAVGASLGLHLQLDGAPALRARPMDALVEAIRGLGASSSASRLPIEIDGRDVVWPAELTVDARTTTQVASGLIVGAALARAAGGTTSATVVAREPRATAYLDVTLQVLRAFGARCHDETSHGDRRLRVDEFSPRAMTWHAPADASAAAFPLVLAAMRGVACEVARPVDDPHPDWQILGDIRRIGAAAAGEVVVCDQVATRPDTFPALCALAATTPATVRFSGAPALRHKESDRIAAMATGLAALGVDCEEHDDGLVVHGVVSDSTEERTVPAPADHRIVMALALLGTYCRGGVILEPDRAVAKSWPGFWEWLGDYADVTAIP